HNVQPGQRKSVSGHGDHHLSKVVSSASDLFHRLQESASHQTLDPASKHLRARTPLGLSVVSLAASSMHLSQAELHRTRQRASSTTDKHSMASKVKSSCLDCLSPGISNTVGRVLIGLIVQCLRLDCVMVTTVALIISGGVTILLPLTQDYAVMASLSAVFGICVAAYIALCSVLLCDLLGVHNLTNAFGYVILFRGVACIIGPPLAGAIIDSTGVFAPAFYLGGGMIVLGGVCHLLLYLLYFTPCHKAKSKAQA
ncbi:monocarboxylate transporter, partial [Elysia marginata]